MIWVVYCERTCQRVTNRYLIFVVVLIILIIILVIIIISRVAALMLNLGNLNLRDCQLRPYRLQGLLSTALNKYKITPSVCNETADTNRPRYTV